MSLRLEPAQARALERVEADARRDLRIARCTTAEAGTWAEIAGNVFGGRPARPGRVPAAVRDWIRATVGRAGWSHFLAWDVAPASNCSTSAPAGSGPCTPE